MSAKRPHPANSHLGPLSHRTLVKWLESLGWEKGALVLDGECPAQQMTLGRHRVGVFGAAHQESRLLRSEHSSLVDTLRRVYADRGEQMPLVPVKRRLKADGI